MRDGPPDRVADDLGLVVFELVPLRDDVVGELAAPRHQFPEIFGVRA